MKFDPASDMRQSAAIRLMQRANAMERSKRVQVVPAPGEPDPARLANARRIREQIDQEHAALLIARSAPALKRDRGQSNTFRPAPRVQPIAKVDGKTVNRLICEDKMRWVNDAHTAVVITDKGRGGGE